MKTINFDLSLKSIEDAIRQIEEYKTDIQRKISTYLDRLAKEGIAVANVTLAAISDEDKGDTIADSRADGANSIVVYLSGDKALFVEFGAGIAFSNPQNPKAAKLGMGVGTYPGQTHAYDEEGWWYKGEDGQSHHSRGNWPYMPLYKAEVEIMDKARSIAREVFGG